jgi:Uma2 family endonuclease
MTPNPKAKMTLEEYFEFDKNAEGNFEYFDGETFEMSGDSVQHSTLEINLAEKLNPHVRARGCQAFSANFRIKPPIVPTYRYPDFSVVCGRPEFLDVGGLQCLANPNLIVEVLSDSVERYDRGEKFREYKSIESFQEYLLISSTSISVTLFQKHNERFWLQSDYAAAEPFHMKTLDLEVNVDDLYQGVDFSVPAND